jgi:hypothetical protein
VTCYTTNPMLLCALMLAIFLLRADDATRVKLPITPTDENEASDYINASYIQVCCLSFCTASLEYCCFAGCRSFLYRILVILLMENECLLACLLTYFLIQGEDSCFIATQGPLPDTFRDFWRMVWNDHVVVILMLTKTIENDRVQ